MGLIGAGLFIVIGKGYKKNDEGSYKKKFVSWARTVQIDSKRLYPVVEVIDGDTLKIDISGHIITTRLLGVNTPEVVDPRKPAECFGEEASMESKKLLTGKSVFVALNPNYERIDKFGRLLAYIWLSFDSSESTSSRRFVNEYLIKEGYAREYTFNRNNPYQYQKLFKDVEVQAKKMKKGLWGKCN